VRLGPIFAVSLNFSVPLGRNAVNKLYAVLISLCILAAVAVAQVQNGQFAGVVTDPSGAAIANATVTVTNLGTNRTVRAVTSQSGAYNVGELQIGNYSVAVEAKGFRKTLRSNVVANAGVVTHLDFKMELGQASETVEVSGEAPAIQTEDSRLSTTIDSTQISNLPLNGRNVYDLMQQAAGAVNVDGVLSENGHNTVVNGLRENFNGFLVNGSSNKGLSGGPQNTPIEDTVAEFQLLTLNQSAQYGNSAGSITNLVQKSGTNALHGSLWEFIRNDKLDANTFFANQQGLARPPLHFNQFGGTIGGPIIKDKLFFFGSYQGDRFRTSTLPAPTVAEGPEFRQAVINAAGLAPGGQQSVGQLLYSQFAPNVQGTPFLTVGDYVTGCYSGSGFGQDADGNCTQVPDYASAVAIYSDPTNYGDPNIAARMHTLLSSLDPNMPMLYQTINIQKTQNLGNLFDGNEASGRIDWNATSKDRVFAQFNWSRQNTLTPAANSRGFTNPTRFIAPNGTINWTHTFGPHVVNEARAGYSGSYSRYVPSVPGVPSIYIGDYAGTMGFGSYNGYPQFFKEHIYNYADMVSINHGNHNVKIGAEIRRNIENSEFNVARPSYYFYDPFFFAVDGPYGMAAGVDPGFTSKSNAQLATNIRHWRNIELGAFVQDDWKVSRKLTLNLGLRYDLFQRHHENANLATTFLPGPGKNYVDNITTGAGTILSANAPVGSAACPAGAIGPDGVHTIAQMAVLAGVCGPGGFAPSRTLGAGDHNNFGPKVGFAYDVFGNGTTSLRGGFGVSYEGTLYNPLSNSRWNPPYYSFNAALDTAVGTGCGTVAGCTVYYGPQPALGSTGYSTLAPSFTGPPGPNNFQGNDTQYTAVGDIMGWNPANRDLANLTGIIPPKGVRDPYVYNYYVGMQREVVRSLVLELNYVGTVAHKLFRAEQVNRIPGGSLDPTTVYNASAPAGCTIDRFGRELCSQIDPAGITNTTGRLNPNYGKLRVWENVNNSIYNSMQVSLSKQMSRGLQFAVHYTWGHAIDNGSTWHSGATSSNHEGAGEGYSSDQTMPRLDRGNSIFDIRHTLTMNYVYELPFFKSHGGIAAAVLGGWQLNGTISYHTGAHWEPFCHGSRGSCDFNNDFEANDRPNSTLAGFSGANHNMWANGWGGNFCYNKDSSTPDNCVFQRPLPGNTGTLARNTFTGPGFMEWNPSLFKNFKISERTKLEFRAESFNILNHTNFKLPGAEGQLHDSIRDTTFGQAGGTFNARNLQFGLKLAF
jgi:Carboxypeptidase regulatory-like domain